MARGYWIVHIDVTDPSGYDAYRQANGAAFAKYKARFLVRGGQYEGREGAEPRTRHVVIEFADYATARACYDSPEYQDAAAKRAGAVEIDLMIVEGYDGPQPA